MLGAARRRTPYYEFLLVYVDDCLVVSHDPDTVMKDISAEFELKNNKFCPPEFYLGAGIEKFKLEDGSTCWSMKSNLYLCQKCCQNC